ncbi:LysR family transcriptional regulator [Parasalinivibrio latis]|uniref:LysR family transcriptional regulator n=1 Tax=Parasalinivibrio latis TaxID=2952610 RepID=UPI0030E07E90
MVHWEGVTEFVAVAETGGFTAASMQLGSSVAHVSRMVAKLEQRLDIRLLNRTTRKVSLTDEGAIYYRHCREVLNGLLEAEQELLNRKQKPCGLIKLTAPVTYGEQYILPLLNDFMQMYPGVEATVELTNQQLDLVEGGYDLAIRLGPLASSSLVARRLAIRRQHVCLSPAYKKKHGIPKSLEELREHNCLLGNHPYWRFHVDDKERNVKVTGSVTYNSGRGLLDAALKGIGVVQLPDYYVDEYVASGELLPVLEGMAPEAEGIWALYPQRRSLPMRVRKLIEFLAASLSEKR